ncbi:MAG: cytochrome c [Acidobacteria bacterium]|nr:cytochrome c [Acidobacteriota bacterium]MBP8272899.1 cytochrome c [Acidobacteriota bacterium]
MNKKMTLATIGMAVVLGFGIVAAAEKAPADYVAAMKAINTGNGQLRQLVAAKDYEGIAKAAAGLKPSVEVTAKFWTAKKVEDASKLSNDVVKAVVDLEKAAQAKDDAGIAAAAGVIGASCRTCHTAHRSERLPDGTYEIK